MTRRWSEHLTVLGAYTLIALVLSYPLALHLNDQIPGVQGDVWSYLWAMGWARVSTFDLGVNPFRDDFVFYPLGGATQLLWATALPSFVSIPLQFVIGLVPAFNLMYLAATVLTAYGAFLLAKFVLSRADPSKNPSPDASRKGRRRVVRSVITPAAFVAGLAFAFSALRLGYGLSFTNLFHTELIPFYILFLLKTHYEGGWRHSILAGLLLGLNVYIDFQIAAFLILFTALWFIAALFGWQGGQKKAPGLVDARPSSRRGLARFKRLAFNARIKYVALIAIVSFLTAAPMIAIVAQDLNVEGSNYIRVYPLKYSAARSYDILSYLLPNARSSLYQSMPTLQVAGVNAAVNVDGESQLSPDRQAFLGLLVLALALVGAFSRPRAMVLWIGAAIVFSLLSFGPTLHFAGTDIGIPLPYAALHDLPIANNLRIPMRYGLMTFISVAILAAAGAHSLLARIHAAPLVGLLSVLILGEAAVLPYPTLQVTVPGVYETISAEPGDFTVLEIPTFNWRAAAATEVFQVIHHKRILRVYTNRIAPDLADYFSLRQTPVVVRSLRILEGAEEGTLTADEISEDRREAPTIIHFFDLKYAVLHRDWLEPDAAARIDQYLREILGARILAQEGSVTAYEFVPPTPPSSNPSLSLDSDQALIYLGRGWQTEPLAQIGGESGRFVTGSASELYFEHTACDCPALQLSFRAYSEKGQDMLQFELNGKNLGAVALKQGWWNYALGVPSDSLHGGLNYLHLLHALPEQDRIAISRIEMR